MKTKILEDFQICISVPLIVKCKYSQVHFQNTFTSSLWKLFWETHQAKKQFLIDMFVENGYKKTNLDKLVKEYQNTKTEKDDNEYCNKKKKTQWITNNVPNIRKESKRVNKDIAFENAKNTKYLMSKRKLLLKSHLKCILGGLLMQWLIYLRMKGKMTRKNKIAMNNSNWYAQDPSQQWQTSTKERCVKSWE